VIRHDRLLHRVAPNDLVELSRPQLRAIRVAEDELAGAPELQRLGQLGREVDPRRWRGRVKESLLRYVSIRRWEL